MKRYRKPAILLISTFAALTVMGGTAQAECQFQVVPLPNNAGLVGVSVCVNESNSYRTSTQRGTNTELISIGIIGGGGGALAGLSAGAEQSSTRYTRTGKVVRITTIGIGNTVTPPATAQTGSTNASYTIGTTQRETKTGSRTDQTTTTGGNVFFGTGRLPGSGARVGFEIREDRKGSACTQRLVVTVLVAGTSQSVGQPIGDCAVQAPRYPDFPKP